jgi:hypothetical protein
MDRSRSQVLLIGGTIAPKLGCRKAAPRNKL